MQIIRTFYQRLCIEDVMPTRRTGIAGRERAPDTATAGDVAAGQRNRIFRLFAADSADSIADDSFQPQRYEDSRQRTRWQPGFELWMLDAEGGVALVLT